MLASMSMKSEAPKLKDFLPFMKPNTFGDKSKRDGGASGIRADQALGMYAGNDLSNY